jgi:hypothetical protein
MSYRLQAKGNILMLRQNKQLTPLQVASRLRGLQRSQQRDIDELKADIREVEHKVMGNLHDLTARVHLRKIASIAWQIDHDPEQVAKMAQEEREAPYRQYQEIVDRHQYKLQQAQQEAHNQIRKNGIWPVEY